jgi:hypothetical protein
LTGGKDFLEAKRLRSLQNDIATYDEEVGKKPLDAFSQGAATQWQKEPQDFEPLTAAQSIKSLAKE